MMLCPGVHQIRRSSRSTEAAYINLNKDTSESSKMLVNNTLSESEYGTAEHDIVADVGKSCGGQGVLYLGV